MLHKLYNKSDEHIGYIDLADISENIDPATLTEQELKDIENSEHFYVGETISISELIHMSKSVIDNCFKNTFRKTIK